MCTHSFILLVLLGVFKSKIAKKLFIPYPCQRYVLQRVRNSYLEFSGDLLVSSRTWAN